MRRIIVTEFITLDGVVEAPGGNETAHPHAGWQFLYGHPESGKYKVEELASVEALLLGRHTYDQFSVYWPTQSGGGFADKINAMPKYIVSQSLERTNWNNSYLLRDVQSDVAELKETEGGDILVYGSARLVKGLLRHKLVDELRLMLFPISIGGGMRLFGDDREKAGFRLKSARTLDNGVLILEYLPATILP